MVSDSLFQYLESEKSTLNIFKKIANKLALEIDIKLIDEALPYLEVRHFLVHADGKLSKEFMKKNKHIKHKKNGVVILNFKFIENLRDSVKTLISVYDKQLIEKNLIPREHLRILKNNPN
jgi:hypothetical protein